MAFKATIASDFVAFAAATVCIRDTCIRSGGVSCTEPEVAPAAHAFLVTLTVDSIAQIFCLVVTLALAGAAFIAERAKTGSSLAF